MHFPKVSHVDTWRGYVPGARYGPGELTLQVVWYIFMPECISIRLRSESGLEYCRQAHASKRQGDGRKRESRGRRALCMSLSPETAFDAGVGQNISLGLSRSSSCYAHGLGGNHAVSYVSDCPATDSRVTHPEP